MKKNILIFISFLLPTIAFAQLKVGSTGRVTIGNTTDNYYALHVAGSTSDNYALNFKGYKNTLYIDNVAPSSVSSSSNSNGIYINNEFSTTGTSIGLNAYTRNQDITSSSAKTIGVRGYAVGNTQGNSYGIAGIIRSTTNGAAIYGCTSASIGSTGGCYAGYFSGNVKVTGTIDGTLVNSSDARLKENVQALTESENVRSGNVLDQLDMLTPVSFNYKKMDDGAEKQTYTDEDGKEIDVEEQPNPVMEHEHFGLIAQELQQVYPNLVYEQDNGYLAVNYVELVPVLMQAIKELNAKVESLEANRTSRSPLHQEAGIVGGSDEATSVDSSLSMEAGSSLSQNVPNPFSEKTDIAIYLPESVETATLYIYDLSGKQLEQHPIVGRGHTVMTIHADRMDAGMYVYSLIADKKVVMTKKMIVTK